MTVHAQRTDDAIPDALCLQLMRSGQSTVDIADYTGIPEAQIYNAIGRARELEKTGARTR